MSTSAPVEEAPAIAHPRLEDLPDLLTIDQLAAYLQVSKGTLYHWRAEKRGPVGFRISGHLRYRNSDVGRWVAEAESQ